MARIGPADGDLGGNVTVGMVENWKQPREDMLFFLYSIASLFPNVLQSTSPARAISIDDVENCYSGI